MLVHKSTMGVLDLIWTGKYQRGADGTLTPLLTRASLERLPELDPADWWEVPDGTALAKRISLHYPNLAPVVGEDGGLLDVIVDQAERERSPDLERERLLEEAAKRGYQRPGSVRPLNLFGFLRNSKKR